MSIWKFIIVNIGVVVIFGIINVIGVNNNVKVKRKEVNNVVIFVLFLFLILFVDLRYVVIIGI